MPLDDLIDNGVNFVIDGITSTIKFIIVTFKGYMWLCGWIGKIIGVLVLFMALIFILNKIINKGVQNDS